ncbi:MAG: radical SAM protein [Bacteroidales bacterium]|nr:radical SAM protein [Bacteroidales bacterium]
MSQADNTRFYPVYLHSFRIGLLKQKLKEANKRLENCGLCPRKCFVNRLDGETGICKTGYHAEIASYSPHFGEEAPLVGTHGSGTIFFTHCNLGCNFCQNFDISHEGYGVEVSKSQLAWIMFELQNRGCHNINFVTPSHVIPQILSALEIAVKHGLNIPLVYNSSGYDDVESLRLLDGIIDIYMPDFKFWDPEIAKQTCNAPDYPEEARLALKEMYRQVGDLVVENGIAIRGLLVRHLVMPYGLAGTENVVKFISNEISKNTYLNIMAQYRPCGKAGEFADLSRSLTEKEYNDALDLARKEGLTRLD